MKTAGFGCTDRFVRVPLRRVPVASAVLHHRVYRINPQGFKPVFLSSKETRKQLHGDPLLTSVRPSFATPGETGDDSFKYPGSIFPTTKSATSGGLRHGNPATGQPISHILTRNPRQKSASRKT